MKTVRWTVLTLAGALLIAACSTPIPRVRTTGSLRVQSVQPDVTAGCRVRAGDWMALKGNAFGTADDWANGPNRVLFPPEPGLQPAAVELTRPADPATLMFQVPAGAVSGTLKLHVEGVGDAEIAVTIASDAGASNAVPGCELPAPPAP